LRGDRGGRSPQPHAGAAPHPRCAHAQLAALLGAADLGLLGPIKLQLAIDDNDPNRYVIVINQSGLGLPNRDQYLSREPVHAQLRAAYRDHVAQLLGLIGEQRPEACATAVLALEFAMAERHWPGSEVPRARVDLPLEHAR
jgi:putative endopeptidase